MNPKIPQSNPLKVRLGRHVLIELYTQSGSEQLEFDIVPDRYAHFNRGYLGAATPMARAIEGLTAGQSVPYTSGDAKSIKVLKVDPAKSTPPKDVEQRRQETIRKAIDQSDRTNAMIFASSFSGKWGNYDPGGFIEKEPDNSTKNNEEQEHQEDEDRDENLA